MSKITESARGQECQVRYPGVCNFDAATTVWAHSNAIGAGHGYAHKSIDECGAYACSCCHDLFDGRRPKPKGWTTDDVKLAFYQGHERSLVILKEKGLL